MQSNPSRPLRLSLAHTPQKAIFLYLKYPKIRYQAARDHLCSSEATYSGKPVLNRLSCSTLLFSRGSGLNQPLLSRASWSPRWVLLHVPLSGVLCFLCPAALSIINFFWHSLFLFLWPHVTDHLMKEHKTETLPRPGYSTKGRREGENAVIILSSNIVISYSGHSSRSQRARDPR